MDQARERLDFLDTMKAIGIVLVVVGHAPALPQPGVNWAYAFHIPLFFWISGYLLAHGRAAPGDPRALAKRLRALLWPYLGFFLLSWGYWLATYRLGARAAKFAGVAWYEPLFGLVSGRGEDLTINLTLWFFPCLAATHVLYALLRRWMGAAAAAVLLVLLAVALSTLAWEPAPRWPWGADAALVALGFFALGSVSRPLARALAGWHRGALLGVALLCALLIVAANRVTGRVDLNTMGFGELPLLYVPTAVAGILMTLALGAALPATRLARWLSEQSLLIFPTHTTLFNFFSGFATLVLKQPHAVTETPLFGVVTVLLALAAAWPLAALIDRGRALRLVPG